jgi:hypothetical protein
MDNENKLYTNCLKMLKDKHNLNEYSRDNFNNIYYQIFNNSSSNDTINELNKNVLKKINESIIINNNDISSDNIQNKIIELQNIRANMNNNNVSTTNNNIIDEYINKTNDIINIPDIKYIKIDNPINNGRTFIINTIKNNFSSIINNKNNISPAYLCIPSIFKNNTPYILVAVNDNYNNSITYTYILDVIGSIWDIWKPANNNYNLITLNPNWSISLYDHTNNYLDLKDYYIKILEVLENNEYYNIKVDNIYLLNIKDKIKILFENNSSVDNTIVNINNNNIDIFKNNIKIEDFVNSKIYNYKYQLSLIFKYMI